MGFMSGVVERAEDWLRRTDGATDPFLVEGILLVRELRSEVKSVRQQLYAAEHLTIQQFLDKYGRAEITSQGIL